MSKLRLSRSFRSKQVQNGEILCVPDYHISEQCRNQEAQAHFSVIAENVNQSFRVVIQRDCAIVQMHKIPLKLKKLRVVLIY